MNEFDPLNVSGGAAKLDPNGAPIDPMEAAARQVMGRQNTAIRANLYGAVNTPADTAARHQRLARETGVPADVVSRNESEVTRNAFLKNLESRLADTPTLAARLTSPDFAALAHDDLETLGLFERVTRQITGGAVELGGMLSSGYGHMADITQRAAALRAQAVGGRTPWEELADPAGGEPRADLGSFRLPDDALVLGPPLRALGADIKGFARDTVMIPEAQRTFLDHVMAGLGQVGGQIVTAPLTGGSSLFAQGVDVMAEKTAGDAPTPYDDLSLILGGGVTAGFEKLGLDAMLGKLAVPIKNKMAAALARIGIAAGTEATTEFGEGVGHDALRMLLINPDAKFDFAGNLEEGAIGGTVGGIVRSIVEAGLHVRSRGARAEHQAKIAEDGATLLDGINKLAAADKVLARDASTLESFLDDSIAEDAPAQDLYVDGRLLMQEDTGELTELGAALAEVSPAVAEQLAEAAMRGGAVRIPFAEYAAQIAKNEDLAGALLDHVRIGEHEFSRAEARQYMQDAPAELEAQLEAEILKAQNAEQAREGVSVVREKVAASLAATGKYSKAVTDTYTALWGSFYETTGQRLGRTAEQMYADYPMQVGVKDAGGRHTLGGDGKIGKVDAKRFKAEAVARQTEFDAYEKEHDAKIARGEDVDADEYFAKADAIGQANEAFAAQLEQIDDANFSLQAQTGGGNSLVLTPSAKTAGKYQLSTFAADGSALGDSQFDSKGEAIRELLNDADVSTLSDFNREFGQAVTSGDLFITHNLTAANLLHAKKMGGIPVPSLAVVKSGKALPGFGEITLMGSKEMADPRGYAKTKVFGADIYSPRYPPVEFFVSPEAKKRAEKELKPAEDATGSTVDWNEVQRDGVRYLTDAPAIQWLFLQSQGITPNTATAPTSTLLPELASFVDDLRFPHELENDPAFVDAAFALFENQMLPIYAGQFEGADRLAQAVAATRDDPEGVARTVREAVRTLDKYRNQAREAGRVDVGETRWLLREQIVNADLVSRQERFAENYLSAVDPTEKIFMGFTDAGTRRYSAHTLDNVVTILKKELRGGESFNYGTGTLRAKFAPQFKSIEDIRKSKSKLITERAFDDVKTEVDNELSALLDSFNEGGADVPLDTVLAMLADVPKMGLDRAAADFNIELSDDTKQRAAQFLTRLRDMPTEYFEAKILRAVDLAEFSGAVVPDDASPEVFAALAERGVKDVRTYKSGNKHDRAAKMRQFEHLLFQKQGGGKPRGTFDIDSRAITLLEGADLSTFLHESGHFFLEIQTDIASRLRGEAAAFGADALSDGERQYLADTDAVMKWFGVADLNAWHALTFEEKRSYHEQYARGFEAYLFEGKAPSLELAGIFGRFRSWLLRIYKHLKNLNVELSPEVRQVFDRMLATDAAIETAEQARSMMPLFESEEGAGGAIADYARYQALGEEATEDAKADLGAQGLRDMKWLANARGRQLKRLQKEAEALRNAKMIDVRAEVMSQPVYRAWQFLTAKLGPDDKIAAAKAAKSAPGVLDETVDDLFVAIAKLGGINKDEAIGTWGVDPADKPGMPVFGKPVWRRADGGMSLDGMAEALGQHGYLELDEHGKVDLAAFESAFKAQLSGEPVYSSALDFGAVRQGRPGDQVVNPAGLSAGRFDLAALDDMDVDPDVLARVKGYRMSAKNGLHPDLVAQLIADDDGNPEFDSGDALLNALAAADPPQVEIEALTDTAMLEEYGELSSPDALERAADAAVHSALRARMITTEANAVAAATGKPRILMSAVREYAAKAIARQRVRNLKPYQYTQAEGRAGKAAQAASRAGDLAQAGAEKRNQVLNNALAREALRARDEVDAGQKYLKKFDTAAGRKGIPAEYMDQIAELRKPFDLKKGTTLKEADRRASLVKWVEAMKARDLEVNIDADMLEKASLIAYRDLTMEQFRALVDAVKTIEHVGKFKDRLLRAQDAREFAEIEEELGASIRANGGKERPVDIEPEKSWLSQFQAQNRKLASLVRQMDGGDDNGPLWRYLMRGANDAGTHVASMNEASTVALDALYAPILKLKGGTAGDLRQIPEAGVSLTRGGRLAVALNFGNETNARRLTTSDWGKGRWNQAQVDAILKTLTKTEWDFVQGVWDHINTYWPEIAAKQRRLTGVAPEKVEPRPFTRTLADGTEIHLRGGYYPIKYDPTKDDKAKAYSAADEAKDMMRGAFTSSTTRRGHTIERVEDVGRPLFLSLDVIQRHIIQVTNDLAWHEWLIDANRIMKSPRVTSAIRDHYGDDVLATMVNTLPAIAGGDLRRMTAGQELMLKARGNISKATMGWSLTTASMQPFGLLQSAQRIGPKYVLRGMLKWGGDAANMENTLSAIVKKSEMMRLRAKLMNRELYELQGQVKYGQSQARKWYDASLFMLMQKMQLIADVPTWLGAYEKALDQGHNEVDAIALADRAVRETQGGGQTHDLTEFQREHPFMTQFFSYFSVTYQLMAESTAATDFKNPLAIAGWSVDMMLLVVLPAIGPALLLELLRGDDEDDDVESWLWKLTKWQASYLFGLVPYAREGSGFWEGYEYTGPPAGRALGEAQRLTVQIGQGEADEAAVIAAIKTIGTIFGLPVTQLVRSYRGWKAWENGDAPGTSMLVGPPRK